jgi:hypothetical protein
VTLVLLTAGSRGDVPDDRRFRALAAVVHDAGARAPGGPA